MNRFYTESLPDPDPDEIKEGTSKVRRFFIEFFQTLLISLVLYFGINAISARIRVQSISMQPTLNERDFVLVNKLVYKFSSPRRGDVIIFLPPPDPQGEPYIKRVIGLPGDNIVVQDGVVSVNGVVQKEPYIQAPPVYRGSWTVPEDMVFVLGDNRNNSSDSHQWGTVPIGNIIGRAEFIYFPVAHWKTLNPTTAQASSP
jgi:signal peptidase I